MSQAELRTHSCYEVHKPCTDNKSLIHMLLHAQLWCDQMPLQMTSFRKLQNDTSILQAHTLRFWAKPHSNTSARTPASAQHAGLPLAVLVLHMLDQRDGVWQLLCAVGTALQAPSVAAAAAGMERLGMEQQLLQAAKGLAALRAHLEAASARRCRCAAGSD